MKRPWQQGHLDGLCGVYALINGMRFFEPTIDEEMSLLLFSRLIDGMGEVGLLPRSLWRGLTASDVCRLLPHLHEFMRMRFGFDLMWERPFRDRNIRTHTFVQRLRSLLMLERRAVALLAWSDGGACRHWSTAHRVSRQRIYILDSGPDILTQLAISHCSVSRRSRARYIIEPRNTIIVWSDAKRYASRSKPYACEES